MSTTRRLIAQIPTLRAIFAVSRRKPVRNAGYANSYHRRRRTWTLIDGRPESATYKSIDAGATWRTLKKGDRSAARRNHAVAPSILGRVDVVVADQRYVTSAPTQINRDSLRWAGEAFTELLPKLKKLVECRLQPLERQLEAFGTPWTPSRFPVWPS